MLVLQNRNKCLCSVIYQPAYSDKCKLYSIICGWYWNLAFWKFDARYWRYWDHAQSLQKTKTMYSKSSSRKMFLTYILSCSRNWNSYSAVDYLTANTKKFSSNYVCGFGNSRNIFLEFRHLSLLKRDGEHGLKQYYVTIHIFKLKSKEPTAGFAWDKYSRVFSNENLGINLDIWNTYQLNFKKNRLKT